MATRAEHAKRTGRSSNWISKPNRLAIYIRDGFACMYCGTDLRDVKPSQVTLDHLTPRVDGGTHEPGNLITACGTCNYARHDQPWRDFAPEGAHARITNARRRKPNRALALAILAGRVSKQEVTR